MATFTKKDALNYHSEGRPGKIEVIPTKSHSTQRDLSLAYSPGVAEPCLEIEKNPEEAYKYTARGNLVAVISNGTAVLGLGDIGALAGNRHLHAAGVAVEALFAAVKADLFDHLAHQAVHVHVGRGRNLAQQQHKAGLDGRLAGHTGIGVLLKNGVQHGIADLVAHLVRVPLGHRLAREQQAGRRHEC